MNSEKVKEIKDCLAEFKDDRIGYYTNSIDRFILTKEDTLTLINELECINKLQQKDIDDLHKEREKRVEDVYADFMADYNIMRDELNETLDEFTDMQRKAIFYYKKAKSYGVENLLDAELDALIKEV